VQRHRFLPTLMAARGRARAAVVLLSLVVAAPVLMGAAQAQAQDASVRLAARPTTLPAAPLALQSKTFRWGELFAGDCHQINGTLTLLSDGTGWWSATTWTDHTHSGDVWHSTFNVLTRGGAGLFNLGEFNSPRMDDGNPSPRYGWSNSFAFNPDQFNAIGQVFQNSSC